MEKQCFTQFSARIYLNRSLTASDFFHMFTWSVKLYTFYCHMLKSADDEKGHSSKVQKINGCSCSSFYSKIWVCFVFNKTLFLVGFTLKSTERALLLIKKGPEIFKIALHLRDDNILCDNHWKFWIFSIFL